MHLLVAFQEANLPIKFTTINQTDHTELIKRNCIANLEVVLSWYSVSTLVTFVATTSYGKDNVLFQYEIHHSVSFATKILNGNDPSKLPIYLWVSTMPCESDIHTWLSIFSLRLTNSERRRNSCWTSTHISTTYYIKVWEWVGITWYLSGIHIWLPNADIPDWNTVHRITAIIRNPDNGIYFRKCTTSWINRKICIDSHWRSLTGDYHCSLEEKQRQVASLEYSMFYSAFIRVLQGKPSKNVPAPKTRQRSN